MLLLPITPMVGGAVMGDRRNSTILRKSTRRPAPLLLGVLRGTPLPVVEEHTPLQINRGRYILVANALIVLLSRLIAGGMRS